MGLKDRIRNITGGNNNNYDDNYDDDYYTNSFGDNEDFVDDSDVQVNGGSIPVNDNYQPSASSNGGISLSGQSIRMKIVRPTDFKSAAQIGRHLLNKETVFLNLENTNRETARRLIDFLAGVAYSIDGTIKSVAKNAYVITPANVDVGISNLDNAEAKKSEPVEEPAEEPADEAFDVFNN